MIHSLVSSSVSRTNAQLLRRLQAQPILTLDLHQKIQIFNESLDTSLGFSRAKKRKDSARHLKLVQQIKDYLNCSNDKADNLIEQNKMVFRTSIGKIRRNIEILTEKKVTTINENPWLLGIDFTDLETKLEMIDRLESTDVNDFVPLISVPVEQLDRAIVALINDKISAVPEGNRIHYFSSRLGVEPSLVSRHFSTHMFMFTISFEKLKENLDLMLDFGIAPLNVLNDLWAFTRSTSNTKARLELCRNTGKKNLKPWVIACAEEKLVKSLAFTEDRKNLLGDGTVIDYLSQRLGYDLELTKAIVTRYKAVNKVRVAKLKSVLDYLLITEKFEAYEVASAIRICCMSLETIKKRIRELKDLGCRPTSLIYVCLSRTDYKKFVEKWK